MARPKKEERKEQMDMKREEGKAVEKMRRHGPVDRCFRIWPDTRRSGTSALMEQECLRGQGPSMLLRHRLEGSEAVS